jgi:hypothetical protein
MAPNQCLTRQASLKWRAVCTMMQLIPAGSCCAEAAAGVVSRGPRASAAAAAGGNGVAQPQAAVRPHALPARARLGLHACLAGHGRRGDSACYGVDLVFEYAHLTTGSVARGCRMRLSRPLRVSSLPPRTADAEADSKAQTGTVESATDVRSVAASKRHCQRTDVRWARDRARSIGAPSALCVGTSRPACTSAPSTSRPRPVRSARTRAHTASAYCNVCWANAYRGTGPAAHGAQGCEAFAAASAEGEKRPT